MAASRKKPPVYSFAVPLKLPTGANPGRYFVQLVLRREDGEPLDTKEQKAMQKMVEGWFAKRAQVQALEAPTEAPDEQDTSPVDEPWDGVVRDDE